MPFSLGQIARTRQQVGRIAPILKALIKHGFGHVVHEIGRWQVLPFHLRARAKGEAQPGVRAISTPRRLAMVLEELGPTFVKLGQMLSTRADLLPDAYLAELRKLTDHVAPFPTSEARRLIEEELGRPIAEVFSRFDDAPIASGSIGQVHAAALLGGEEVVVKVKRPRIERTIFADLDLLELVAHQLARLEDLKPFRPVMIVEEFRRTLRRELDFVAEAALTTKIRESLADNPRVRVPRVHWDVTTSNVLVMERVDALSLNRRAEIEALGLDKKRLARDLVELFLRQFFKTGLFHADPHPGNILVAQDGRIVLVDFGMTGRLDSEVRRSLATSFIALTIRDLDLIVDVYVELGAVPEEADRGRLKNDLHEVLDKYYGIPIQSVDMQACFSDLMRVARTHGVMLPRDFVLLGKSFVTMVMMARELDPAFDLSSVVKPYARSLMLDKVSPHEIGRDLVTQGWYLVQMMRRVPRELHALLRKALSGRLGFDMNMPQFSGILQELDKATNRLAFSFIVSAIVVGSSILLHAHVPPFVENVFPGGVGRFFATHMPQISLLGLSGFLFAGVLGLLLAVAIWRSGRL